MLPTSSVLSGWKEIANYLGKGVRTVQRYEREHGLPVRRPAAKAASSVLATTTELDAWIAAAPLRASFQLPQRALRHNPIDMRSALRELHGNIDELHQLRHETAALHITLSQAMQALQETLRFSLSGESSSERRTQADVLDFPSRRTQ